MKRWFLAAILAGSSGVFAQDLNADVAKQLQALQQQLRDQQQQIEILKSQLQQKPAVSQEEVNRLVKTEVQNEMTAALETGPLAELKDAKPLLTLGKHIDNLKLAGDLRLRYEHRTLDSEKPGSGEVVQKSRFRHRVRLGGVWTSDAEDWEVGLGVEAGSSKGTSANDSWNESSTWESGDLYLDYAYAKHRFGNGISATLGQQKNPFTSTFVMFDGDLRPTGATLQYSNDLVFATAGAYNIRGDARANGSEQSLANMYAAQVGVNMKTEGLKGKLALGYWHYDSETTEFQINTAAQNAGYQYQIASLYGELAGKAGPVALKLYGETAMNFGADKDARQGRGGSVPADYESDDNNLAWILGVEAKYDRFRASYAYAHIQGDAIPWFVSDSDFGAAIPGSDTSVNVQGHQLGISYALTKNCSIGATAVFTELIESSASANGDGQLYQFDLSYKF